MNLNRQIFLILIIVSLIPITIVGFILYGLQADVIVDQEISRLSTELNSKANFLVDFLDSVENDILVLKDLSSVRRIANLEFKLSNEEYRLELENDLYHFSHEKDIYYQVRYIDETGFEIARVNNINEDYKRIPKTKLQNKSDRYYFTNTIDLEYGDVFISPIDLNVEDGEIEVRKDDDGSKYVPVLRYSTPVFDRYNDSAGIIIVNVYADNFLDELKNLELGSELFLVNQDGYYLANTLSPEKEWSFMFDVNQTFSADYGVCHTDLDVQMNLLGTNIKIIQNESKTNYLLHLFIYLRENMFSPNMVQDGNLQTERLCLMMMIDEEHIYAPIKPARALYFAIFAFTILLVVFSSVYLSRLVSKPIEKIDDVMTKIADGDYKFKVDKKLIARKDEFGYLGRSVEFVREMIGESDKLFRKYNIELEDKVIERTTDLSTASKKTKRYASRLEHANKLKDLFTDIMHHDLKNPLTVMKALTDANIMVKKGDPKYLKTMSESIGRMQNIINFAANYAKVMSNAKMPVSDLDLKEIVYQSLKDVKIRCDNAGMKIVNRIKTKMPIKANEMVSEVFQNLFTNAIKYAREGKRIIIEANLEGNNYFIRVIDFGKGISDTYKKAIFLRFERSENVKGIEGSGIGLGIVKKIVKLHKGDVWVEDNPAGGSIFVVRLPKK